MAKERSDEIGKRVRFDRETWQAIDLLAKDSMRDFQELAGEAFADLLKKHHRPVGFAEALKQSVRGEPQAKTGRPAERRRSSAQRRGR